jgi:hypothetical protein
MSVDESQFLLMLMKLKIIFADCEIKLVKRQDLETDDAVGHFVPPYFVYTSSNAPDFEWKFDYDDALFITQRLDQMDEIRNDLINRCGFNLTYSFWVNKQ